MKPHVYIFRGAPASGKSTIVPQFCELLSKPVVLISEDIFRWSFHLIGREIPDVQDDEHLFAYRNAVLIYEQYLKRGHYSIVLEGLFTWDDTTSSQGNAKELVDLASKYGYNAKSIVLQAEKDVLLKRNAARSYSVPMEEYETLYSGIYKTIDDSEIVIDSTDRSIEDTLALLRSEL